MKKNLSVILFCALLVVFIGCRPRGILSSNEMREVLVDLHKTDAMLQMAGIGMMDKEQMQIYYAQVLQRHGITQAQFDSSLVWYTAHPQLFNKIYPKVLSELESEEHALAAQMEMQTIEETKKVVWIYSLDTTYFLLLEDVYPTLRMSTPSVHDSVNQLLPQISVLR